jgi:putative DNA primase/helicase
LDDLRHIAHALGGEVSGYQVLAPGNEHSPYDRSLAVRPAPNVSDGLLIYSHSGDDWRTCREHVLSRLSITPRGAVELPKRRWLAEASEPVKGRIERAAALWREGTEPRGTLVERYLGSRGLALAPELALRAIRFHAACPWRVDGEYVRVAAMLAVMRDIHTNEITAVQRTALSETGAKIGRMTLGRKTGAAIKLSADEEVTMGVVIGEGLETVLSAMRLGFNPAWAVGDASNVRLFPILSGIGSLTIIVDNDENGVGQRAALECSNRWTGAGREVFRIVPNRCGEDINDVVKRIVI